MKWISVNERLPKEAGLYIVYRVAKTKGHSAGVDTTWFWPGGYWEHRSLHEWEREKPHHKVTHWMPLPDPPRGDA